MCRLGNGICVHNLGDGQIVGLQGNGEQIMLGICFKSAIVPSNYQIVGFQCWGMHSKTA